MDENTPAHDCPSCGDSMRLALVTPKIGPHPDLLTFRCDGCGEVLTRIGDEAGSDSD